MPVTLNELAKAAGVSVSTVSRALTASEHPVNEETRQRILTLAKELGYRPNMMARSLKTDRTFTVGIIVDNIASPFTPLMIRGIQDYLKGFHYFSVVINADWNPEAEAEAIHDLISRSIDGIVFVESWLRDANPVLDLVSKPYVFVHRLFGGAGRNSVNVDDVGGGRLATEHLIGLGHRRIGFISGPAGWGASEDRLVGYRAALQGAGIPYDPTLMIEGNWEVQSGYPAAKKFLTLENYPTAIFAGNDLMALGAIYAIQESGLRVPEDIAVVGYDDREIASIARPSITTVTLPCYEMGQRSAKLLLQLLEKETDAEAPIKIQGKLLIRESSGAVEGKIPLDQYKSHTTPRRLAMLGKREH
jgi:LacI family transcriptional regulator